MSKAKKNGHFPALHQDEELALSKIKNRILESSLAIKGAEQEAAVLVKRYADKHHVRLGVDVNFDWATLKFVPVIVEPPVAEGIEK
jgi:hypothetical protein